MKNKLLLIICLIFSNIIVSQEYFYYYGGNKIPLELNTDYIYVSAEINKRLPSVGNTKHINVDTINESYLNRIKGVSNTQVRHNASINLGSNVSEKEYFEIISNLTKNEDVIVAPSFGLDGDRLELSEYFYVCLKQLSDTILLFNKSMETNVRIVAQDQFMEDWFTLAVTENSQLNSLETANVFYESGLFRYAEPDFRVEDPLLSNDPKYPQQWGLKNTGQNEGVVGMDINVEPAWNYSTGAGIVVAVIDQGVQLNHPDLQENIYYISYDTETNTSPSRIYGDHGTSCAGIIGAMKDNNNGIAGIAPDCKLMSISNALITTNLYVSNIAKGINWAWMNGADIISNSYHAPISSYITDAINNAVNYGRNGLGCPVLFASGNNNVSSINFPASLANTIAVGAMNPCGERKNPSSCDGENWGSNYGDGLDIVAPGVLIPTTIINSDYTTVFNGTSAACPHAAGVMALILSANPCLSQEEARAILCATSDKITGNGNDTYSYSNQKYGLWNNEVGYGKINAYKAVSLALSFYGAKIPHNTDENSIVKIEESQKIMLMNGFSGVGTGLFIADVYEITQNISFPYIDNPIILCTTNGYSAANPNNELTYVMTTNVTNTSATLKTWCYHIQHPINSYIPTLPSNVYFDIKVIEPSINRTISNHQLTSGNYDYAAFETISTNNFSVTGTANVNLHAGDEIMLLDGTFISPGAGGSFFAYIEPFNPCSSNQSKRGSYDGKNNLDNSYQDYLSIEEENYINDLTDDETISVFPNPNRGSFNVLLYDTEDEIQKVVVYDMMGNIVYSDETFKGGEINLPDVSSGMYHLTIILNKQIIKKKIIIQ